MVITLAWCFVPKIAELKPRMSSFIRQNWRPSAVYLVASTVDASCNYISILHNDVYPKSCTEIAGHKDIQRSVYTSKRHGCAAEMN